MIIVARSPNTVFTVSSADVPPIKTTGTLTPDAAVTLVPVGSPPWMVTFTLGSATFKVTVQSPDVVISPLYDSAHGITFSPIVGG